MTNREMKRERRKTLVAEGLCASCGREPVERFTSCRACRARNAARQKAFRTRQKVAA